MTSDSNYYTQNHVKGQDRLCTKTRVRHVMVIERFFSSMIKVREKVKQSHYRPGQALRAPGGWGSQISGQSAQEGGKVVSSTHRPPLPNRIYFWYSFLLESESTPGTLCQWKIQMTPSGIEPATFRFVAQCFNQMCHRVLRMIQVRKRNMNLNKYDYCYV
jgi:hypothetical protein